MFQNTLTAFAEEGQFLFSSLGNHVTPLTCNVHFGVPGGQGDCVQIGICRVTIDAVPHVPELAHENRHCRQAAARVTVNQDGGIDMFFPKEGIMPCTERAIFRNKWFPVPVAHHLPFEMINRLEPGVRQVISVGRYPVSRVPGGYVISF
jgi:hypothetical protein